MKKIISMTLVTLLVSVFLFYPVSASHADPVGSCPSGYERHHFMDHDGEHLHRHIGVTTDLNGDGYICMKVLTNDLHLHVDNNLPLP